MEDDQFDLEDSGVETDADQVGKEEAAARRLLEGAAIADILADVANLPIDTKVRALKDELDQLKAEGFDQTMVFTGYTDTMDGLRDWLVGRPQRVDPGWREEDLGRSHRHRRDGRATSAIRVRHADRRGVGAGGGIRVARRAPHASGPVEIRANRSQACQREPHHP